MKSKRFEVLNIPEGKKSYLNFLLENDLIYDDYYEIYVDGLKLHTEIFGYKESTLKKSISHHAKSTISKDVNCINSNFLIPLMDAFFLISNYKKRNLVRGIGINDIENSSVLYKETYLKWIRELRNIKKESTLNHKVLFSQFLGKN